MEGGKNPFLGLFPPELVLVARNEFGIPMQWGTVGKAGDVPRQYKKKRRRSPRYRG